MGQHKGWRVRTRTGYGRKYLAEAWDPQAQRYTSQRFDKYAEASDWARDEHAKFRLRLEDRRERARRLDTEQCVERYLEHQRQQRLADRHIANVAYCLRSMAARVPVLSHPQARDRMRDWWHEATVSLAAATANRYLRTVRAFLVWQRTQAPLRIDPLAGLRLMREARGLKEQFSFDELVAMAGATSDRYFPRFMLALWGGLRQSEVHGQPWSRVDLPARGMVVVGKGQKTRWVPIHEEILPLLERLRDERDGARFGAVDHRQEPSWPLSRYPGLWSTAQVQGLLGYRSAVGLKKSLLRHGLDPGPRRGRSLYWRIDQVRPLVVAERGRSQEIAELDLVIGAPYTLYRRGKKMGQGKQRQCPDFKGFLARLGIEKGRRSPHSLRHCYAGLMTATGVPSQLLAAYMGHDKEHTTGDYASYAARYVERVRGWRMGQFGLLTARG